MKLSYVGRSPGMTTVRASDSSTCPSGCSGRRRIIRDTSCPSRRRPRSSRRWTASSWCSARRRKSPRKLVTSVCWKLFLILVLNWNSVRKKVIAWQWDLNAQPSDFCLLAKALPSLHGFGSHLSITFPLLVVTSNYSWGPQSCYKNNSYGHLQHHP